MKRHAARQLGEIWPYLLITSGIILFLPLWTLADDSIKSLILFILIPAVCLLSGLILGAFHGVRLLYPVCLAAVALIMWLLALVGIDGYGGLSSWPFILIYAFIGLLGNVLPPTLKKIYGFQFRRHGKR